MPDMADHPRACHRTRSPNWPASSRPVPIPPPMVSCAGGALISSVSSSSASVLPIRAPCRQAAQGAWLFAHQRAPASPGAGSPDHQSTSRIQHGRCGRGIIIQRVPLLHSNFAAVMVPGYRWGYIGKPHGETVIFSKWLERKQRSSSGTKIFNFGFFACRLPPANPTCEARFEVPPLTCTIPIFDGLRGHLTL